MATNTYSNMPIWYNLAPNFFRVDSIKTYRIDKTQLDSIGELIQITPGLMLTSACVLGAVIALDLGQRWVFLSRKVFLLHDFLLLESYF